MPGTGTVQQQCGPFAYSAVNGLKLTAGPLVASPQADASKACRALCERKTAGVWSPISSAVWSGQKMSDATGTSGEASDVLCLFLRALWLCLCFLCCVPLWMCFLRTKLSSGYVKGRVWKYLMCFWCSVQLSGAYFRPVAESQQGFCHGSCSNITSFNSTSACFDSWIWCICCDGIGANT